jgi:hypothetical protein
MTERTAFGLQIITGTHIFKGGREGYEVVLSSLSSLPRNRGDV